MTHQHTTWNANDGIVHTRLTGIQTLASIDAWEQSLDDVTASIRFAAPTQTFRALVDIRGYEVDEQDRDVHQRQRVVVPLWLARHGLTVGFFGLYEVENTIVPADDAVRCSRVAHVHHDQLKMDRYNELLASERERFFTDPAEAHRWLVGP